MMTVRRRAAVLAERAADEAADVLEVRRALARAGQHDRQGLILVRGIEQDAERGRGSPRPCRRRPGNTTMPCAKRTKASRRFSMSGMIDQLVDDRVGRLRGDDAGLGDADVAAVLDALLGMADGRALHRALHRARSAARADVEAAQPHLVADALAVLVLVGRRSSARPSIRPDLAAPCSRAARELRSTWNTALVMSAESVRSKRPPADRSRWR